MDTDLSQLDPELRRNLAITLGTQQPQLAALRAPAGPEMAAPGSITLPGQDRVPNLAISSPAVSSLGGKKTGTWAPQGTIPGDKQERARQISTGAGVDQIYGKVTGSDFGQDHPIAGKALGGLAQGIGKLGDIGLSAVAPALAINLPGTEFHHAAQLHGLNKQIGAEEGEQEKEAQTANLQADVPLRAAQAKKATAEAEAEPGQSQATLEHTQAETNALNRPDLAHAYATAVQAAMAKGVDPSQDPVVQHLADAITSIQKTGAVKESQPIIGADGKPHVYALDERGNKVADLGVHYEKPVVPPGVTVVVPDPNNPGGGTVQRLTPGQTVAPGAQTATQFGSMNTPTNQQRNVVAQAELVHREMPATIAEIQQNADALGPVMGNWNEFMQGKIGMENPQFAGLRADLLMMSSAVALMHARGRLPENLREEFDRSINAPKQTAANLIATLQHIDKWTSDNIDVMGGRAAGGSTSSGQKFTENGVTYNIPADQVQAFKKDHPNAR